VTSSAPGAKSPTPEDFAISVEPIDQGGVVSVQGEVDVYTSPAFREHLYRLIDDGATRVIVDFAGMDFIDSSGLGVLVGALKRIREQSGEIELRGLKPSAKKIFDITGLTQVFSITD
jgi:anti-sigma B factor antagonist